MPYRKHIAICPHCRQVVNAEHLTHRQWEVARRLIEGQAVDQIAHDLFICRKTVGFHRTQIYEVTGTRNMAQLIRWAFDRGLLELMGWTSKTP
jgi:DNA-binding NarL/FixJ family response regulator